jgi:hypothetical protein
MSYQPIPDQLAYLHWSSGHDFRLSGVKSRQARETRVRFPDGELLFCPRCPCPGRSGFALFHHIMVTKAKVSSSLAKNV